MNASWRFRCKGVYDRVLPMGDLVHVVCPHCGQTDSLPSDKLTVSAQCGKCHKSLFDGHPVSVDGAGLEKHRHGDIPVLVDVWAPWCGPCRAMTPMFESAAKELEPKVRLLKLNADEELGVAGALGVAAIPTLLLMDGERVLARTTGAMDGGRIVDWVRAHLPHT